jgi:hypothetical protein
MFLFPENMCANIECLDVHAQFYFRIFKMCFHIVGSYTPMSRNEYSGYSGLIHLTFSKEIGEISIILPKKRKTMALTWSELKPIQLFNANKY